MEFEFHAPSPPSGAHKLLVTYICIYIHGRQGVYTRHVCVYIPICASTSIYSHTDTS